MTDAADRTGWGTRIGAMVGLFVAAVAVRALPAPTVLLRDRIQPFGGDAFYHLRRIAYSMEHFPESLAFDRYLNFPTGAVAIWTPVFDWMIAAVAMAFGAEPASVEMERIAVWVPPLLGAANVVVLYRIAARTFGEPIGRAAAALLCISSGHFWYSQIGFVDHHVAVALVTTILLGSAIRYLDGNLDGNPDRTPRVFEACSVGVAIGAALWIWPGTLLHVGIVELALLSALCLAPGADPAASARRFATVQSVALILMLPAALGEPWPQWGAFSPVVLSAFQLWLFAVLALIGFACWALWRSTETGASNASRVSSVGSIGGGLLLCSLVAIPGLWIGAADAWQWLGKAEHFQSLVSESLPLLQRDGRFSTEVAATRLSYFVFLSPIALLWAATSTWRSDGERTRGEQGGEVGSDGKGGRLLVIGWTAVLLAATLLQKRFFNTSSIGLALLMAWSLAGIHRAWTLRSSGRTGQATWLVVAATALLLLPSLSSYHGFLQNWRGADRISASPLQLAQNVAMATSEFIRQQTPPTSGWLDADVSPEYGVMAPWPMGHVIEYVARRPTITDGFGDDLGAENFELASRYYLAQEAEALSIVEGLGARYVIVQRSPSFLIATPGEAAMLTALFDRDGSGLGRHRLVYESAPLGTRSPARESLFKLFEVIPGAEIVGRAPPGAQVSAALTIHTNRKRQLAYRRTTIAGSDGRYALRVPYSNREAGGNAAGFIRVAPSYRVSCVGSEHWVRVDERAVTIGLSVAGPELHCH